MSIIADYLQRSWTQPVVEIPSVGRDDLARYFAERQFTKGVEIGTERGLYAETLLRANPRMDALVCVDPYRAYKGYREHKSQDKLDRFYDEATQRIADAHSWSYILRLPSIEAAQKFPDRLFDFVYIDGNHSLLHVVQDLCYWVPKVRAGGIVAGHDYIRRKRNNYLMHVEQALTAYCDSYTIRPLFILGRKHALNGETRDRPRSWLFIKE